MNTAVINIKTQPRTKMQAQEVAKELGVSLSVLINAFLKHLVRTKKVTFTLNEEPSEYLLNAMKKAKEDWKKGRGSPIFNTGEEAVKWLKDQRI